MYRLRFHSNVKRIELGSFVRRALRLVLLALLILTLAVGGQRANAAVLNVNCANAILTHQA